MLSRTQPDLPFAPATGRRDQEDGAAPYKVVSIRLRSAEYESFTHQVNTLGLNSNLALRIAARRIAGFLEIDRTTRGQLEKIVQDIGEISKKIGSLHTAYAQTGKVDQAQLAAQRVAFGKEFAQLDALLRTVLNVSRSRSDGLQRLEEAMK